MPLISRIQKVLNGEMSLADHIPYLSHLTENILSTRNGDYVCTWKIGGISFHTADPTDLQIRLDQLNQLFISIASTNIALWTHIVRRDFSDRLKSEFDNDFCREYDKKYYDSFAGYKMMANELYLTLCYRPHPSTLGKITHRNLRLKKSDLRYEMEENIKEINRIGGIIEASLKKYDIERLGVYEDDNGTNSSTLEFLNFLVSGEWTKVRLPGSQGEIPILIHDLLGSGTVHVGNETLSIQTPTRTVYAQAIDFKDYPEATETGLLNALLFEEYSFIFTQSYSFLSKRDGKTFLERQRNQLRNAQDAGVSQVEQIDQALDDLMSGRFAMGSYHASLFVYGDSPKEVVKNINSATAAVQDIGFIASKITLALAPAFFAQLPCNEEYRPRIARITSENFSGMSSFHNFVAGKRNGNPWGPAVIMLKTPSGQPYYFNFHATKEDEDNEDEKRPGNTLILGMTGAGKTVLLSTLASMSQKFASTPGIDFTTVFFDKDRGAEVLIRALGGRYLPLENGKPTGFNPFHLPPTEDNILFLESLVLKLLDDGHPLTASDKINIDKAIRSVMRLPNLRLRRLAGVAQFLPEGTGKGERDNSLFKRLSKWVNLGEGHNGPYSWVFDNPTDILDFTTHRNYGFDGTAFLDNSAVCAPISMYLIYRMEQIIDGRRFIYFMDEFWKWLRDPAFSDFAFNKQKTIRKQNGLGVFATQSPSDVLKSPISAAIVEQCATSIFLPNPKASEDEYVKGFKLTKGEFETVRNFDDDSRLFMIKQGNNSAVARLDLQGFNDEMAILSGSTDNVELLETIIAEVGDNPKTWIPIYKERVRERRLEIQSKKS